MSVSYVSKTTLLTSYFSSLNTSHSSATASSTTSTNSAGSSSSDSTSSSDTSSASSTTSYKSKVELEQESLQHFIRSYQNSNSVTGALQDGLSEIESQLASNLGISTDSDTVSSNTAAALDITA